MTPFSWLALVGLAVAAATPPARADTPTVPGSTQGQGQVDPGELFKRGFDLFQAKDYEGAILLWERLMQLVGDERGWKVLYNLGLAYEKAGHAKEAVARYETFIQRVAEQTGPLPQDLEERRQDAAERAKALKAGHPELAPPPPASETSPPPPAVPSSAPPATSVPAPAPAPPPASSPPAAARSSFPTTWLLLGAGATVVSFAMPVALALRTQAKRDDAEQLGAGNTGYASARDDYDSARTLYYVSFALPLALATATAIVVAVKAGAAHEVSAGFVPRPGGGEWSARVSF